MEENQIFWVVWNPAGGAPTVKHETEHMARIEALRLASQNPGQDFVVLQSIGTAKKVAATFTPHHSSRSIPF